MRQAAFLNANPALTVTLEGHCDERGTREYNLALGERRGSAARDPAGAGCRLGPYPRCLLRQGTSGSRRLERKFLGEEPPRRNGHQLGLRTGIFDAGYEMHEKRGLALLFFCQICAAKPG